jgi:hypothetical protein
MTRSEQLAQQRHDLQLQCALQRQQLSHLVIDIESRLVTADRVLNVVSIVTRNPVVILAATAGTLFLRPWRIMKWVTQGAMLFSVVRRAQQLFAKSAND